MSDNIEKDEVPPVLTRFVNSVGHIVMHVYGILVLIICLQVVLRYVFGKGLVTLEEVEWHLWAVGFLFGLSYCVVNDTNIRMDLLYKNFSERTREWLDIFGLLFIVLPFVIAMIIHGFDFTYHSWNLSERSDAPLGLPYRWIIKSTFPISMALLGIAVLARLFRFIAILKKRNNGSK